MATSAETLAKLAKLQALSDFADKVNAKFAGYYTKSETETKISAAVAAADHLKRKIVTGTDAIELNASDAAQYIYMVLKSSTKDGDKYDEYMVLDGALEKVGNWEVDLSDYAKSADMTTALAGKVDVVEGSRLITDTEATKLEGLENYTHPAYTAAEAAFVKVGRDATGHVVLGDAVAKTDIDAIVGEASTTAAGLMSAADKAKLDGIAIATDAEVTALLEEKFGE